MLIRVIAYYQYNFIADGSDSDNKVATTYFGMIDEVRVMLVSQINNIAIKIVDLLKCKDYKGNISKNLY